MAKSLSHYDPKGRIQMVDVSGKPDTVRQAIAESHVRLDAKTLREVRHNPKGDPLEIARPADNAAAKRAAQLIPLCHPWFLTHADVSRPMDSTGVHITSVR